MRNHPKGERLWSSQEGKEEGAPLLRTRGPGKKLPVVPMANQKFGRGRFSQGEQRRPGGGIQGSCGERGFIPSIERRSTLERPEGVCPPGGRLGRVRSMNRQVEKESVSIAFRSWWGMRREKGK